MISRLSFRRRRLVLSVLGVALLALIGSVATVAAISAGGESEPGECATTAQATAVEDGKVDGEQADNQQCADSDSTNEDGG